MNIINYLHGTHPLSWNMDYLIKDMVIMLQSCDETCISHVYQEGNSLVYYFSNLVVSLSEFCSWEEGSIIPENARNILRIDGFG